MFQATNKKGAPVFGWSGIACRLWSGGRAQLPVLTTFVVFFIFGQQWSRAVGPPCGLRREAEGGGPGRWMPALLMWAQRGSV